MKLYTPKKFGPVVCPHCESQEVSCVHKPHVPLSLRIVKILSLTLFLFFVIPTVYQLFESQPEDWSVIVSIVFGCIFAISSIVNIVFEYANSIYCICHKCGSAWRHK